MGAIKNELDRMQVMLKRDGAHFRALKRLRAGLKQDEVAYVYGSPFWDELEITPANHVDARALALDVARALGSRRPIRKAFNATSGKITYSIPWGMLKIQVCGGDARCKVEAVEEREWVPPRPADGGKYVTRTRYKIVNPDECGA